MDESVAPGGANALCAAMADMSVGVATIDMAGATLTPGPDGALPSSESGWLRLFLPVGLVTLEATSWVAVTAQSPDRLHVAFVRPGESFLQRLHHYLESTA